MTKPISYQQFLKRNLEVIKCSQKAHEQVLTQEIGLEKKSGDVTTLCQPETHTPPLANRKKKTNCYHFLRKATVATRDPTDPPNMNVGYVLTWLRYSNGGWSVPLAASEDTSPVKFDFLMLKFSTSSKSSSFVLLHDVITFWTKTETETKEV